MAKPKAVKSESRICFGISYFDIEADADAYTLEVQKAGRKVNGGYFHGMACGRAKEFDHVDPKLGQMFAVTD